MSRPSNWHDMTSADRRAWEDAEYEREEAVIRADRERNRAARAEDQTRAVRAAADEERAQWEREQESLIEDISETRIRAVLAEEQLRDLIGAVRAFCAAGLTPCREAAEAALERLLRLTLEIEEAQREDNQ